MENEPSEADINAASFAMAKAQHENFMFSPRRRELATAAIKAVCDPERGLERLVRLGDVLASVRRLQWEETIARHTIGAVADHIEREFLGDQTQEPVWTAPDPLNVAALFTGTASMWERRYAEARRSATGLAGDNLEI